MLQVPSQASTDRLARQAMKQYWFGLLLTLGLFFVASGNLPSGFMPQGGDTIDNMEGGSLYVEADPSESLEEFFGAAGSEPGRAHYRSATIRADVVPGGDPFPAIPSAKLFVKHIPIIETIKIKKYKLVLVEDSDADCVANKARCILLEEAELGSVVRTKPVVNGPAGPQIKP